MAKLRATAKETINAINDEHLTVRKIAIHAIIYCKIYTEEAVTAIIHALSHPTCRHTRHCAAEALGNIKPNNLIKHSLLERLQLEEDNETKIQIIKSLRHYNNEDVVAALVEIVQNTQHSELQSHAVCILGQFRSKLAVEPIITAISDSSDSKFVKQAALALGSIGNKTAISVLRNLLITDTPNLADARTAIQLAIGELLYLEFLVTPYIKTNSPADNSNTITNLQ